jgi:hypothetical protein
MPPGPWFIAVMREQRDAETGLDGVQLIFLKQEG